MKKFKRAILWTIFPAIAVFAFAAYRGVGILDDDGSFFSTVLTFSFLLFGLPSTFFPVKEKKSATKKAPKDSQDSDRVREKPANKVRTVYSSSSQSNNQYQDRQWEAEREKGKGYWDGGHSNQERQWEAEREKERKKILEDWYCDYVTIEVDFDFHIKDSEYNQDYWDRRCEDLRVTRREAMALIEAGEGAIMGRLGYSNRGLIRNVGYKVPYGLYDRPMGC